MARINFSTDEKPKTQARSNQPASKAKRRQPSLLARLAATFSRPATPPSNPRKTAPCATCNDVLML